MLNCGFSPNRQARGNPCILAPICMKTFARIGVGRANEGAWILAATRFDEVLSKTKFHWDVMPSILSLGYLSVLLLAAKVFLFLRRNYCSSPSSLSSVAQIGLARALTPARSLISVSVV